VLERKRKCLWRWWKSSQKRARHGHDGASHKQPSETCHGFIGKQQFRTGGAN
jgi:hypothetical protein